jgi:hypothetical protein
MEGNQVEQGRSRDAKRRRMRNPGEEETRRRRVAY